MVLINLVLNFFLQAQCNIDTEADAEIALQISNSLTQALLEYRLNSLAKAVWSFKFIAASLV